MRISGFIFFYLLIISLTSCKQNRLKDVNLDAVPEPNLQVQRLDRDLFALKVSDLKTGHELLLKKHGAFYASFIYGVINHGEIRDSVLKAIAGFITDKDMKEAYADIEKIYSDDKMEQIRNKLNTAFRFFNYHFPTEEKPKKITAFMSGFNYNITTIDSTLGLGLDMYLGSNNKFYQMLQWPRYKVRSMNSEHLVSDAMRGWITHCFDKNQPMNNLLSHMIFYGKLYYALDAVLPDQPDSIKISYTSAQIKYCNENERNLWRYFSENDRLYKNDLKELAPYVSEGPFTSAISKECPPRIAMWVGWQIIRSYMNRNESVSLEQLMKENDAQKILAASKYKP